jgi:hypothetical protein
MWPGRDELARIPITDALARIGMSFNRVCLRGGSHIKLMVTELRRPVFSQDF